MQHDTVVAFAMYWLVVHPFQADSERGPDVKPAAQAQTP